MKMKNLRLSQGDFIIKGCCGLDDRLTKVDGLCGAIGQMRLADGSICHLAALDNDGGNYEHASGASGRMM